MSTVRVAGATDDDGIARLLLRSFSHLYASMGVDMSPTREAYLRDQGGTRGFATSFICEVDEVAVGKVTLVPPSFHSVAWIDGAWDLRLLAVDPGKRGLGIARGLIKFAEGHARASGEYDLPACQARRPQPGAALSLLRLSARSER